MLTVICGGMFAEKSTELQRRGKRLKRAGKEVLYIKPDFDNRYSEEEIVTHDGKTVPALSLSTDIPHTLFLIMPPKVDVILIDEVQFFHEDILKVINILLEEGTTVIVAGLDLDFEGKPFSITSSLMATAEHVVKLHAVCTECGNDAWVSYKEPNGKRIELGADEYKPMCRKCFYQKRKGGN
jgi:thymidine kinase